MKNSFSFSFHGISLRYLQFESRVLPSIESIGVRQPTSSPLKSNDSHERSERRNEPTTSTSPTTTTTSLQRPNGLSCIEYDDNSGEKSVDTTIMHARRSQRSNSQPKLPSLLIVPKITASMDNCKFQH